MISSYVFILSLSSFPLGTFFHFCKNLWHKVVLSTYSLRPGKFNVFLYIAVWFLWYLRFIFFFSCTFFPFSSFFSHFLLLLSLPLPSPSPLLLLPLSFSLYSSFSPSRLVDSPLKDENWQAGLLQLIFAEAGKCFLGSVCLLKVVGLGVELNIGNLRHYYLFILWSI